MRLKESSFLNILNDNIYTVPLAYILTYDTRMIRV